MCSYSESTSNCSSPNNKSLKDDTSSSQNKIRTFSFLNKEEFYCNTENIFPIYEYFRSSHLYLKKQHSQIQNNFKSNIYRLKDLSSSESNANNSKENNYLNLTQSYSLLNSNSYVDNSYQHNYCNEVTNNENVNINNSFSNFNSEEYVTEMFGRRGWICNLCSNFNYETRKKCNKCAKIKIPRKIITHNLNISMNENDNVYFNNKINIHNKHHHIITNKDWICCKCNNLNYAFRIVCNRCQFPKEHPNIQTIINNSY